MGSFRIFLESIISGPDAIGLIKSILADIKNDAIWLVFADWLEDRGDPVGDVIRAILQRRARPKGQMRNLNQKIKAIQHLINQPVGNFDPKRLDRSHSEEPPYCTIRGPMIPQLFPYAGTTNFPGTGAQYVYYPVQHQEEFTGTGIPDEIGWVKHTIPANTLLTRIRRSPEAANWDFPWLGMKVEPQPPEFFIASFYGLLRYWIPLHIRRQG